MSDNSAHIQGHTQDPAALQQLLQALAVASGVYSTPGGPSSAPSYHHAHINHYDSSGYPHTAPSQYSQNSYSVASWSQPSHHPPLAAVPSSQIPQSHASTSQMADKHTSQPISTAEEKRRRNTEASARFRVKKKLKTVHLQTTVDDLTGRAEDLEREAAELRKENSWLKEIVMLKGRNIPTDAIPNFNISFKPPESFSSVRNTRHAGIVAEKDSLDSDADGEVDEQRSRPSRGKRKSQA